MTKLTGKKIAVIGATGGVGTAIVRHAVAEDAHTLAVARGWALLDRLAREIPGVEAMAIDACRDDAPMIVLNTMTPDLLVVCSGARPPVAPLQQLTWSQFAANWDSDVKTSFLFSKAALLKPLPPGSTVLLISSGAALGGSPISGGYAGAKRTQMFIANYAQKESDRLGLGIRFIALAPSMIMPDTELGRIAVEGYAEYLGVSPGDFVQGMKNPQSPHNVADAVLELFSNPTAHTGSTFTVSLDGIAAVG